MGFPLLLFRGSYTWVLRTGFVLGYGQQMQADIITDATGAAFTMVFEGGRDNQNKLVSSGDGQTCLGRPAFQAPAGAAIYDRANQRIWKSNGWIGGKPANGIDLPSYGMISASNFLGWTAFSPGSSSSNGNGLGNVGTVDGGTWS